MAYDTEQDSIALDAPPSVVAPPETVPPPPASAVVPPSTPWSTIDTAAGQLNAGQPVTALPRQSWTIPEQNAFNARLDAFDQQAKAARAAAQNAALDAQMFDQMSRVAKSTKDIEIAKRSIDMMGLQRDIQNGVPIHEAVTRHPMALGTSFGNTLKSTAPIAPPTLGTVAGVGKYLVDSAGKPHFEPSGLSEMPLDSKATEILDPVTGKRVALMSRTGPRTQGFVRETPEGLNPSQEVTALRARAAVLEQQYIANNPAKGSPEEKRIQDALLAIDRRLEQLTTGKSGATPAKTIAVPGGGTKDDPARPETDEQFNSIPSGLIYRNPRDGKLYKKK